MIQTPVQEGYTNNQVFPVLSSKSRMDGVYERYLWGIMDQDAINGAEEFIGVGSVAGIATTIGFEMWTGWS